MYLYRRTELDIIYLHKNMKKNKVFLINIFRKSCLMERRVSQTASQCSPQNSPSCRTLGRLFQNGSFSILTSSCHVCLHLHKMLWLYWLDGLETKWIKKKAVSWVWVVLSAHWGVKRNCFFDKKFYI